MREIKATAARARFAELLNAVEGGETIVITRRGKPVARLIVDEERRRQVIREAMEGIRELRKQAGKATVEEILAWRDEGRK